MALELASPPGWTANFSVDKAVLAAGFAFEAYNEPSERDARWERGADGCDVAFMSEAFARECYEGRLEVKLCEVRDLPVEQGMAQQLLSGGNIDPYVIFALNEENEKGPQEGAIGLGRAVDRARSTTVWSKSLADRWKDRGKEGGASWGEEEKFYLYVKDPSRAQLALTIFDEEVLADDIPLGATSIHLADFIRPAGSAAERTWSGWVPMTWRPEVTQDNAVMIGTVAGAAVAGPAGAAVGAFVGNLVKKPVQGEVRMEIRYTPLTDDAPGLAPAADTLAQLEAKVVELEGREAALAEAADYAGAAAVKAEIEAAKRAVLAASASANAADWLPGGLVPSESAFIELESSLTSKLITLEEEEGRLAASKDYVGAAAVQAEVQAVRERLEALREVASPSDTIEEIRQEPTLVLSSGAAKGGTEGLDWSTLAYRVGEIDVDEGEAYELCCFVSHTSSSTQAAIWRQPKLRKVVMAFRGTSDVLDVVTDVNLLQTPLEARADGKRNEDDERMVHSGFKGSAEAINRRMKELLVAACAGTPGEWEVLITGHSLGGALATLMAADVAEAVDVSRGFRAAKDTSWWGQATDLLASSWQSSAPESLGGLPALGKVSLYTFGAPRVGNSAFARHFEQVFAGKEAFRIVNDKDIVARMPRHANSAGAVLDYEHVGRTVLIAEKETEASGFNGFWIEGSSPEATCPLRDASPLTNPFARGALLGDVKEAAVEAVAPIWGRIDGAAKSRSRAELKSAVDDALMGFGRAKDSIVGRVSGMQAADALSLLGFDRDFIAAELDLVNSLREGTAIEHHLEPSYFEAMTCALDSSLEGTEHMEA